MNKFRCFITVLLYVFLAFNARPLFPQSDTPEIMLDRLDLDSLNSYLDTADRRGLREQWLDYARFGMNAVLSSWEKEALLLASKDSDLSPVRADAEQMLEGIIEKRLAEWLNRQFFNSADPPSLGLLSSEIEKLNLQYLYEQRPDGSLRYKTATGYEDLYTTDATGTPVLVQKGEKSLWGEGVRAKITAIISGWTDKMSTAFSDLKASVTDDGLLEAVENGYARDFDSYRNGYLNQLYRLYNLEQSKFTRLRLYDQYSLQHQSEAETAAKISNKLIVQTQAELNSRLDVLVRGLNTKAENIQTGGIINADDWRESFAGLLDQGMNSWDAAERELLMQRIEWEQDAGNEVAAGEQAWSGAFHRLREERSKWMSDFRNTLEEGNRLWEKEGTELKEAIDKAVSEIDENIANSEAALHGRIDNLTGMLLQSVNMMRTARNSWEYWMDRFDEGEKDSFDTRGIDFNADSMKRAMNEIKPGLTPALRNDDPAYTEALYWLGMFETYQAYARDSQTSLAETYGIVVFDNPSLQSAFDGEVLSEALLDDAILLDQDAWEAVYLDEYQVELLKARACMRYWQKQQQIAQAVYDYAADNSSAKEDAEITSARLDNAKAAYEGILAEYADLLDRLSVIGNDLETLQTDMKTIQEEIDSYNQQLADARVEYNSTITDLQTDNPEYLAGQYREFYLQLLESMGMKPDSEERPSRLLEEYLSAARRYGLENDISLVSRKAVQLLAGRENTDFEESLFNPLTASLTELRKRMLSSSAAGFTAGTADDGVFSLINGGESQLAEYLSDKLLLPMNDYRYDRLLEYYREYNHPDTEAHGKILWEMQRLADEVRRTCINDYELRLAELKLVTTDDFSSWALEYFDTDNPDDIFGAESEPGLDGIKKAIAEDCSVYEEILLLYNESDGEEFEIFDWESFDPGLAESPADSLDSTQALQLIWEYNRHNSETDQNGAVAISEIIASLKALSSWLESLGNIEECIPELESAVLTPDEAKGQQYLKTYLSGSHNLSTASGDIHYLIFADSAGRDSFRSDLAGILLQEMDCAPCLSQYSYKRARSALIDALEGFGMIDSETMNFSAPEAVWDSLGFTDIPEITEYFTEFDAAALDLTVNLPGYITEVFSAYINELKDYFSVRAASAFPGGLTTDTAPLNREIRLQANRLSALNAVIRTLQNSSDDSLKLLKVAIADGIAAELKQEAGRRLTETAGLDLASKALNKDGFNDTSREWRELFDDYASADETGLSAEDGLDDYRTAMTERARSLYCLALSLENPDSTDEDSASAEWLETYRAMIWNSLDFADAAGIFTGTNSTVKISTLEQLKLIYDLMPENRGDFPSDINLSWLYGGNEVLREIDGFIRSGRAELWASDAFSAEDEVKKRYYSEDLINSFGDRLALTADEAEAGMSVRLKAETLWNDEFKNGIGSFEGILKAWTGLRLIHSAVEEAGEYTAEYGSAELLEELTDGIMLSKKDSEFLEAAADDPEKALNTRMEDNALSAPGLLSGEELFWNLAWRLRSDASRQDYSRAAALEAYVFNDPAAADLIRSWINRVDSGFDAYSAELQNLIGLQIPQLTRLAETAPGSIYAGLTAYSLGAVLTETAGYGADDAAEFVNWFLEVKNMNRTVTGDSLADFVAEAPEQRIYAVLAEYPQAAIHYFKNQIADGLYTSDSLETRLGRLDSIPAVAKAELRNLQALMDDLAVYNRLIHGDFEDYLDYRYPDNESRQRMAREVHMRFTGSPWPQWDDTAFISSSALGADAQAILETLGFNRTRTRNTSGINPECGMSANDVFITEILMKLDDILYGETGSVSEKLTELRTERDLQNRAAGYLTSVETADADNWRSFLNAEYLSSGDDELNLVPSGYAVADSSDYARNLHINDAGEDQAEPVIQDFSSLTLFRGTGNDQGNIVMDAANSCLDGAAYLAAAINSWKPDENIVNEKMPVLNSRLYSDSDNPFWNNLEEMTYTAVNNQYSYEADEQIRESWMEKRTAFYNQSAKTESLKNELSSLGYRRERLLRMMGMGSNEQLAELKPLKDMITALETDIDTAQNEWQLLIDGENGYRMLENEYAELYGRARSTFDLLKQRKHELSTARAIYDYASSGYLSIDEELLSEFETGEADEPGGDGLETGSENVPAVETGITGGTSPASDLELGGETDEQDYLDGLLDRINRISPAERLTYISGKLTRATAAYEALALIISGNKENYSIYSEDQVYRSYFDAYLKTFRESLALNKINLVLNKAIARQEAVTRDALADWNRAIHSSYGDVNFETVPAGLEAFYLNKNDDGSWRISWGKARETQADKDTAAETFTEYFAAGSDSETGFSCFESDLSIWLEKISSLMQGGRARDLFTTWALALRYEALTLGTEAEKAAVRSEITTILNRNGEADLDRAGAETVITTTWKNAYNRVNGYSGEDRWLYDFYKLLDKGGIMQADINTTSGKTTETFDMLAKEESIILANRYMADKYHEGADNLIISSIPMFATAALYYAIGALLMTAPFGWIAAILYFALAVGMTLGASFQLGEGKMKHEAAKNIETGVIAPAEKNISRFMLFFSRSTADILKKKKTYEDEYDKLRFMKGEADDGITLTDAERVEILKTSTLSSFANEGEDLHGLLVQAGLAAEDGDAAADLVALDQLFDGYQGLISDPVKEQCTNSSRFISALETGAQEYKQATARELNDYLTKTDGATRRQAEAEEEYRRAYYRFISEEITRADFEAAAETAWAAPGFSVREHMLRLYEEQARIAEMIMGSDQFNAGISAELLQSQKELLTGSGGRKGIHDYRMSNYRDVRQYQILMLKLDMIEKRKHWENQMMAITARGELEWSAGERKFNRKYGDWRRQISRTYNKQKTAWDDKYLDFLSDKQNWLDAVTVQSTKVGDKVVLENFGDMTGAAIASAGADLLISGLNIKIDPESILSEIIDFELLGLLLDNAESLNNTIGNTNTAIFTAAGPDRFTTSESLQAIKDFQYIKNEEYAKHLAELEYERMIEQVETAEENFYASIETANENLDNRLNKRMRDEGYKLSGSRYEKEMVTGSTLDSYIYSEGYVSRYRDYIPADIDFGSDLKDARGSVENLDAKGLRGLVAKAVRKIETQLKKIFGDNDDPDANSEMLAELGLNLTGSGNGRSYTVKRKDKSITELSFLEKIFGAAEPETDEVEDVAGSAELSPGLFGVHVGYAPEFAENADITKEWNEEGQIKYMGLGEMGRIMGEFIFNKMIEGAGWAEVNMPHYKKRLWDDTDTWIKAPSTADLAGMAVTACTLGAGGALSPLITAGINLSDDLALAAMDIGIGEKSFLEGGFDFLKTAAISMAGAGLGELFGGLKPADLGQEILFELGHQAANNLAGNTINAADLRLNENGEYVFSYDLNAAAEGLFGEGAMAGYLGNAAGTAAGTGLSSLLSGSWTTFEQMCYGGATELGKTGVQLGTGYIVHAGYQLATDGFGDIGSSLGTALDNTGISLNLLDLGSLLDLATLTGSGITGDAGGEFFSAMGTAADNLKGSGLFALNINSREVTGQITTGGKNIGKNLYSLGKGVTVDTAIRAYEAGNRKGSELLRQGYIFGDQAYENTMWSLVSGRDELIFDTAAGEAETTKKSSGGRSIHMDKSFEDLSHNELLKAVTVLQHESYRDGAAGPDNDIETLRAVKAHTEIAEALGNAYGFDFIAGDRNLLADLGAYMAAKGGNSFDADAFRYYVGANYDSTKDYWKLIENPDGSLTLHDDGRGGIFYTDENGEEHEIGHYTGGSRTSHLQNVMGLNLTDKEKARLNSEMLVGLGSAESYQDGHFIDKEGRRISIDLEGEWSDRMGAALDYNRMFVDSWRSDGNMDMMIEELRYMNISERYGADYTEREKYLADMYDKAVDFSARFEAGTATEFLFNQTEIEKAIGFGDNSLCYGTVPVNLYQLRDPSISMDMVSGAMILANEEGFIRDDGYIRDYDNYLKLLGQEFKFSQYLASGQDYSTLESYWDSDYTIADYAIYGQNDGEEHHVLFQNNHDTIDPYTLQLSWNKINHYRYRALYWIDF